MGCSLSESQASSMPFALASTPAHMFPGPHGTPPTALQHSGAVLMQVLFGRQHPSAAPQTLPNPCGVPPTNTPLPLNEILVISSQHNGSAMTQVPSAKQQASGVVQVLPAPCGVPPAARHAHRLSMLQVSSGRQHASSAQVEPDPCGVPPWAVQHSVSARKQVLLAGRQHASKDPPHTEPDPCGDPPWVVQHSGSSWTQVSSVRQHA